MKKKRHHKRADAVPKPAGPRPSGRYDWTELGLHLLIFLPPFVFMRGVADSFRLPKLVLSGTLALLAVALLCLRLARRKPLHPAALLRSSAVLAVLPLLAVASIGLWASPHRALVARTLPWMMAGCVFLVATTLLLDSAQRRRALQWMMWPAAVLAFIGLLQALGLWQPMDFQGKVNARLSVTSLAGGAFDLAAYLLLPLLLAQERLWSRRDVPIRSAKRWAWGVLVVLLAAALVATQTLGAIVAGIAGSLVFWIQVAWSRAATRRRMLWVLGAGFALVLVAVMAAAPVRDRVVTKARQLQKGEVNVVLTGRLDGWRAALWMAREQPLTGIGTGAFRAEFGDARMALQDEGVEFYPGHRQPYFVNAHNDALEALAEWGWPAVPVVLWLLWLVGRRLRGTAGTSAFLTSALVAMVIVTLTNFPWRLALIAFPWLLVVADLLDSRAVTGGTGGEDGTKTEAGTNHADPAGGWPARPTAWALTLTTLVAASWLFGAGRDRVGAQRLVQTAESVALESERRGSMPPRALELGLDLLRRAEMLDPAEVSVEITRGGLFMVGGRSQAAERSYRRALEMENRAEVWINLARMRLAGGDREGALEAARNAHRLDTRVARKLPEFPELEDGP